MTSVETCTLAQRLKEGRLSTPEALRIAMRLAEALRSIHEEGHVHGALSTSTVSLTLSGVELVRPRTPQGLVTPYTAPEVLQGQPADARSDIFSFGAIVYELFTGRWPFEAETPETLSAALLNTPPPRTGNPALDTLVTNCLAKDPAARWQRVQKAQLELRLLSVSSRRGETSAHRGDGEGRLRAEIQQAVESRLAAHLQMQEKAMADLQQAITLSLHVLHSQVSSIETQLAAAQQHAVQSREVTQTLSLRMSSFESSVEAAQTRISGAELQMQTATERIARAEHTAETVSRHSAEFAAGATTQIHALQQTVQAHADTLESARTALSQTDDLVERVVEALDSLQSIVLEKSDERAAVS